MKKFTSNIILLAIFFIVIVGVFNFVIDPFYQYRKPIFYKTFYAGEQRYKNPGFAKRFDYNSIIIGSSMTENFLISESSKIMTNPIKLCISGGTAHEIFLTLNTAFETNKNIDTVMIGLDIYAITGKVDRLRHGDESMPLFLYDKNYFNDYLYLLSLDTLKNSGKAIIQPIIKKDDILSNYENMYQWQHLVENQFGKDKVLAQLKNQKTDKNFNAKDYKFEKLKTSFDFNLLSVIKKHPEANFIIFYPPYSVIAYQDWKNKKILADILLFKKYAFAELNKLSNAKLYDFQSAKAVTHNLDNYKDYSHYHQKINTWMIDKIKHNEYRVTEKNVDEINSELLLQSTNWSPLKN
jgi:hypothetical protein